ncbi:MAG: DUF2079 domain-containing protein [Candidatus Lernaella stagnicola]|nr:DUF2079 domain-containing protein [Candidatus Lernaella stagnicola]
MNAARPERDRYFRMVLLLAAAAALLFFGLNWLAFQAGHLVKQDDHLLINEIARNILRGDFGVQAEINGNLIGTEDHFTPTFLLIVPLYLVWDHVTVLLFCLSLIVAFAVVPFYLLGRFWGGSRFGLFVAAAYLLLPETAGHALSGMWQQTPLWLLAPLTLYACLARKWWLYVVAAVLLLGTFEDAFLILAGIGLLALVEGGKRRWWLFAFVATAVYVLLIALATDNFGGGRALHQVAPEVLRNAFSLGVARGLVILVAFMTPLLWLAALRPRYLIPAIAPLWLALAYLGGDSPNLLPGSSTAHYFTASLPFILAAAIAGAASLRDFSLLQSPLRRRLAAFAALLVLLGFNVAAWCGPDGFAKPFRPGPDLPAFQKLASELPATTRLATDLPYSYLLDGRIAAAIKFSAHWRGEAFELQEHYWDWPALRDFRPRLYAYQTQRTKRQLGGLAVTTLTGGDTLRTASIDRVFGPDPYCLAAGDLDGDGRDELVAGTVALRRDAHVAVLETATGRLRVKRRIRIALDLRELAVVPGDGSILFGDGHTYRWWRGTFMEPPGPRDGLVTLFGTDVFSTFDPACPPPPGASATRSGDFNGDGERECAVGYPWQNSVEIRARDGRLLGSAVTGPFPTAIVARDLDGDGRDELITPLHNRIYDAEPFFRYLDHHAIDTLIVKDAPPAVLRQHGWQRVSEQRGVSRWCRVAAGAAE